MRRRQSFLASSPWVPSASAARVLCAGVASACLLNGCITSAPGDYGVSAEVRELKLSDCPNGTIDDAEDQNSQITLGGSDAGYWFTFKDEVGSTIEPSGDFKMSEGGAEGSKYAAHMKGKMAAAGNSIYVGMGFQFANPKGLYDVGKAQGIRFWAKGPGRVRFKTPDVNTEPSGDRCTSCYNDFGVDLQLSDKWERYTVPFSAMRQQDGWGDRAPSVSKDKLFAAQWQFGTPGADYDIWIDNIALVGCAD
jgi:endoglucanase